MDEARREHFPFHSYWPLPSISAPEPAAGQQYVSNDLESQLDSPFSLLRNSVPTAPRPADTYENSTRNDRRLSSSVDPPRRSFSPSTDASDGTDIQDEKKERPLSQAIGNQVDPSSLQSVKPGEDDKEAYRTAGTPPGTPSGHSAASKSSEIPPAKKRICGVPALWFFITAGVLSCIIVGLALGLGVGLGLHHSVAPTAVPSSTTPASQPSPTSPPGSAPTYPGNPEYDIGGTLSPLYYSTAGAFNGTGIALATSTFDQSGYGSINLYFQHYDGSIRWLRLLEDGGWQGGSIAEIITADGKNGTPIAAVAYAMNDTSTWHLFYIDTEDVVRQKTFTNVTNLWEDGPINNLNVQANGKPMVGLQACWFGNLYGDSEYTHSPQFNDPNVSTTAGSDSKVGMHLFVGDTDTSFQQYGWLHGEDDWTIQDHWPNMNSQAGVGCYSWGPGTVTYVFMVDLDNTLNIYWKDTNSSLPGNATHPINEWVNSSIAVDGLHPSSSLGYTNYLYAQLADETIHGYNISFDAENTAFVPRESFQIQGLPGVPGTHLSVTSLSDSSGGESILAFYQTYGNDITEYSRGKYGGQWSGNPVTIP